MNDAAPLDRRAERERNRALRDKAANTGQVRYHTGVPCKRGHMADRWTSSGACIECTHSVITKANAMRDIWQARIPIPPSTPSTVRVAMQNYLARCAQAYLAANGLQMPIHPQALDWGDQHGKCWFECPY